MTSTSRYGDGRKFLTIPAAVLNDRRLNEADLRVLLVICLRADNDTGKCWPSIATLAEDASVSTASVKRALPRLVGFGWVKVDSRRRRDGSADSNLYSIDYKNLLKDAAAKAAEEEAQSLEGLAHPEPTPLDQSYEPTSAQNEPTPLAHGEPTPDHSSELRGGFTAVIHELPTGTRQPATASARETSNQRPAHEREETITPNDVRALLSERAIAAYDALCANEAYRGATAEMLLQLYAPLMGGQRFDWPTVSTALIEAMGQVAHGGGRITANWLRGFCRKAQGNAVPAAETTGPLRRATALWRLAMDTGLIVPRPRDVIAQICSELNDSPQLADVGVENGLELLDLVLRTRLWEFADRRGRDERFVINDLAQRMTQAAA